MRKKIIDLKQKILNNLSNDFKYIMGLLLIFIVLFYFMVAKNILSMKEEKIYLKKLEIEKEEMVFLKNKLKSNFEVIKEKRKEINEEKEKREDFIYHNSYYFKVELEEKFNTYKLKNIQSSRMEKEIFNVEENKFYKIKIYYEVIGRIEEFKNFFLISESSNYRIEPENFFLDFNEEDSGEIKVKMKISFLSYEKEEEKQNEEKQKKIKKNKIEEIENISIIKIKNKNYYIMKIKDERKKIIKDKEDF